MKITVLILCCLIFTSCTRNVYNAIYFKQKQYSTEKGHLFGSNTFKFENDSNYIYIGHGPAIAISKGFWHYEKGSNSIILKTIANDSYKESNDGLSPIDTVYLDLSKERIKVVGRSKIEFKDLVFYSVR
jgi:hypothetical protein